jgi:hypothetical protein
MSYFIFDYLANRRYLKGLIEGKIAWPSNGVDASMAKLGIQHCQATRVGEENIQQYMSLESPD